MAILAKRERFVFVCIQACSAASYRQIEEVDLLWQSLDPGRHRVLSLV